MVKIVVFQTKYADSNSAGCNYKQCSNLSSIPTSIVFIIINHFEKYSLITQKQSDYILFKNIVGLINKGEHLNIEGLGKIISLKAFLNKGLSEKLRINFPSLINKEKRKINTEKP